MAIETVWNREKCPVCGVAVDRGEQLDVDLAAGDCPHMQAARSARIERIRAAGREVFGDLGGGACRVCGTDRGEHPRWCENFNEQEG